MSLLDKILKTRGAKGVKFVLKSPFHPNLSKKVDVEIPNRSENSEGLSEEEIVEIIEKSEEVKVFDKFLNGISGIKGDDSEDNKSVPTEVILDLYETLISFTDDGKYYNIANFIETHHLPVEVVYFLNYMEGSADLKFSDKERLQKSYDIMVELFASIGKRIPPMDKLLTVVTDSIKGVLTKLASREPISESDFNFKISDSDKLNIIGFSTNSISDKDECYKSIQSLFKVVDSVVPVIININLLGGSDLLEIQTKETFLESQVTPDFLELPINSLEIDLSVCPIIEETSVYTIYGTPEAPLTASYIKVGLSSYCYDEFLSALIMTENLYILFPFLYKKLGISSAWSTIFLLQEELRLSADCMRMKKLICDNEFNFILSSSENPINLYCLEILPMTRSYDAFLLEENGSTNNFPFKNEVLGMDFNLRLNCIAMDCENIL